jgi:hypothetical protein
MFRDQFVIRDRGRQETHPDDRLLPGLLVRRHALQENGAQRGPRCRRPGLQGFDPGPGDLVQQPAGVQQERAPVRETVHDQAGGAAGSGRDRAHGEALQALGGQDVPDRAGQRLALRGAVRGS